MPPSLLPASMPASPIWHNGCWPLPAQNLKCCLPMSLKRFFSPWSVIPMKRSMKKSWGNAEELSYALGWRVIRVGDKNIVFHAAMCKDFVLKSAFVPKTKWGLYCFSTAAHSAVNDLLPEFFSSLYQL